MPPVWDSVTGAATYHCRTHIFAMYVAHERARFRGIRQLVEKDAGELWSISDTHRTTG